MPPRDTSPLSLQYKGSPVPAFQVPVSRAVTSTSYVDVGQYNAVHIDCYINATGASFDLIIEGSNSASGVYLPIADPNSTRSGITSSLSYNVLVGAAFARARIANVSGTFANGQGIQVFLTGFIAGGTNTINTVSLANENLVSVSGATISLGQKPMAASLPVVIASDQAPVSVGLGTVGGSALALGPATMANSLPVTLASNQTPLTVIQASTTGTVTSTAVAQATTTILSANTSRKGATVYNDSTAHAHVKLGAGCTASDFTVVLQATTVNVGGYYEVPYGYTGIITAYLGSAGTGNWRVTELT